MRLVEGVVRIGEEAVDTGADSEQAGDATGGKPFPSVEAFVARLNMIAEEHGVTVQAFDARYIVGREHVESAVERADRARNRGEGIARDRGVEILLYAAGRRQINRALEMGVGEGQTPIVAVVDDGNGSDWGNGNPSAGNGGAETADAGDAEEAAAAAVRDLLNPAETLGDYDGKRVREFFDVSECELVATNADLADLVLERVALLDVEK